MMYPRSVFAFLPARTPRGLQPRALPGRGILWAALAAAPALAACGGSERSAASTSPPRAVAPSKQATTATPPETRSKLEAAVADRRRDEKDRARDVYRHPVETLTFFGLRDDMRVVEIHPSNGWYTPILAPVLAERGQLVLTGWTSKVLSKMIEADPPSYRHVTLLPSTSSKPEMGPAGSADLVLTFRNVHNWIPNESNPAGNVDAMFAAFYQVLKPGGVLGVVEHRAKPGTDLKASAETGYMTEQAVIGFAERAGFGLAGKSEVNANPKDTKDHPEGVWTLPPRFALGDKDRAKYEAIGESDRMTLKFVKPGA